MPAGRPLKFKSVAELQKKIDDYFESCWEEVIVKGPTGRPIMKNDNEPLTEKVQIRPYTITGLAVALGTTRETLLDYEGKEEYSDTIKRAKAIIEKYTEEQLFLLKNPAGAIFNLTNNYRRWVNRQQQELSGPGGGPVQTQNIDFDWEKLAQDDPNLFDEVVALKNKLKSKFQK